MVLTEVFAQIDEDIYDPHIFKALFLAGTPGSGKTMVGEYLAKNTEMRYTNVDRYYELFLANRHGIDKPVDLGKDKDPDFEKSQEFNRTYRDYASNSRLGVVFDVTGAYTPDVTSKIKRMKELGYDVAMLYVKTDLKTAIKRQALRNRRVSPDVVKKYYRDVVDAVAQYQKIPGVNFAVFNNSRTVTHEAELESNINDPRLLNTGSGNRSLSLARWFYLWVNTPVNNPIAQEWIAQQKAEKRKNRNPGE